MIVQTRYMKGKQVNRATIFDFVQAHKNDGDNIISNDKINASWCIEFLIDYLYQVISIFNEAIENVKAGVNNPVSDTGLEELYINDIGPYDARSLINYGCTRKKFKLFFIYISCYSLPILRQLLNILSMHPF